MSRKLGVVMDHIETIQYKKDTTLAVLWAAQDRGWSLFYMTPDALFLDGERPMAVAQSLTVHRDPDHWFDLCHPQDISLAELDICLMRKDPPFDMEYIYATYLLERAERQGTLIVNRCHSLRDCNEKLFATEFPECCPTLLVSRDMSKLKAFHRQHQDVIFKPLDGMGGSAIFRAREDDPNVSVILETLTQSGRQTIMAQCYLPAISEGDKRILMVNGEPIPYCLARVPLAGESRGNLAAGGSGRVQPLSERDLWIASQVGPTLKQRGLYFVGLDVIGDYLTEINVTSPTCLREIEAGSGLDIAGQLLDTLEEHLTGEVKL
ncbi:MAG: glutathione synthase [Luminiphilus sp.]|nr:glutathione synthase [Luminiphilus sp.]MBL6897126.1 glutathione synthase [Luminiphilus sp.]MDB2364252.1 glutathione synthase [Luminiphilus sp.]